MTEPNTPDTPDVGGATDVGSIAAHINLNMASWREGVAEMRRDSEQLGGLSPNIHIELNADEIIAELVAVRATIESLQGSIDGMNRRMDTYSMQTTQAAASTDRMERSSHGLLGTLLALSPVIAPLGAAVTALGVGGGAALLTLGVGVKAVNDGFKGGGLAATEFAGDLQSVSLWMNQLKTAAGAGLLVGFHEGVAESSAVVQDFISDTGTMSMQLGQIAKNVVPGLLTVLHRLQPLIQTIGSDIEAGSEKFKDWATNSDGITKFVDYANKELPVVIHTIADLASALGHVIEAGAPFGGVLLRDLDAVARAIDAVPIGVLQALIPVLSTLYIGMRAYGAGAAIVNAVSRAWTGLRSAIAALLPAQAAQAAAEARVTAASATAAANRARAAAQAAAAELASAEAAGVASAEQIASYRATAVAAEASAATQEAAAAEAASAAQAAGARAAAGWSAVLGPLGLIVGALAIFGLAMGSSSSSVDNAKQAQNDYNDSLKQTLDLTAAVNLEATAQALKNKDVYATLDQVNGALGKQVVTSGDLVKAVNGTQQQYDALITKLKSAAPIGSDAFIPMAKLIAALDAQRKGLLNGVDAQEAYNEAAAQLGIAVDNSTGSVKDQKSAVDQLSDSLQTLVGQYLDYEHAVDAAASAGQDLVDSVDKNGKSLDVNTIAGRANREALLNVADALVSQANAYAQQTGDVDGATQQLHANVSALINQADQLGLNHQQVLTLLGGLTVLGGTKATPQVGMDTSKFDAGKTGIVGWLKNIAGVGANPAIGLDTSAFDAGLNHVAQGLSKWAGLKQTGGATGWSGVNTTATGGAGLVGWLGGLLTPTLDSGPTYGGGTTPTPKTGSGGGSGAAKAAKTKAQGRADLRGEVAREFDRVTGSTTASADDIRKAGSDLYDAAKAAGASKAELQYIQQKTHALVVNQDKITNLTDTLTTKQTKAIQAAGVSVNTSTKFTLDSAKQLLNDVKQAKAQDAAAFASGVQGSFDITSAGVRTVGAKTPPSYLSGLAQLFSLSQSGVVAATDDKATSSLNTTSTPVIAGTADHVSLAQILSDSSGAVTQAKELTDGLKKLASEGLDQAELSDLASQGLGALPMVRELLKATPAQIKKLASNSAALSSYTASSEGTSKVTAAGILADSSAAVAKARRFKSLLEKVSKEGLDKNAVMAIAQKGLDALPELEALATMTPAQVRQIASNDNAIQSIGTSLGADLSNQFDSAGVAAAQGLVAGLQSQSKAIAAVGEEMGDALVNQIKKKLDIHSPSRVLYAVGVNGGVGMHKGLRATIPDIRRAANDMAGAAVPGLAGSGADGGAARAGVYAPITVNPSASMDENALAIATVNQMMARAI